MSKRVVIIGGGFGGLNATRILSRSPVEILLIDQQTHQIFLPMLPQVATGEVCPEQIAYPLRRICSQWRNVTFKRVKVDLVDYDQQVIFAETEEITYDFLIIGTGSTSLFYDIPGAKEHTLSLKNLFLATNLRDRIFSCFEKALQENNSDKRTALLTFTIVGGGATGVELAASLAELTYHSLIKYYCGINFQEVKIILLEAFDSLLPMMHRKLRKYAQSHLHNLGVEVHLSTLVSQITSEAVYLKNDTVIPSQTVIWAAGVQGYHPANTHDSQDNQTAHRGQIVTVGTLQMPNYPNVYVIGDVAQVGQGQHRLPLMAPVAIQEGKTAAQNIIRQLKGKKLKIFRYFDKGSLVIIGHYRAVLQFRNLALTGFIPWLIWLGVHLFYLRGSYNRWLVLLHWIFNAREHSCFGRDLNSGSAFGQANL